MKSRPRHVRALAVLTMVLPLQVLAYTFEPGVAVLRPKGDESSRFFTVRNSELCATAVEITIHECRKDLAGEALLGKEAEDDFLVYPAQIVMLPGDEVRVQVRWIGSATLRREQAYKFVIHEVPVPREGQDKKAAPVDGSQVDVSILVNYEGWIYVSPAGAQPDVVVESVTACAAPVTAAGGELGAEAPHLEVICVNRGTTHKKLQPMALILTPMDARGKPDKAHAATLTVDEFPALKTNLLAGDRRRFVVPRPASLPPGPVQVTLAERVAAKDS